MRLLRRHPTPIEARAPPVAECADSGPRGLETQSCPGTGLLMTSDVTGGASVVSRLGAGAASNGNAMSAIRGEGGCRIIAGALPDLWSSIARGARGARVGHDRDRTRSWTARLRLRAHPTLPPVMPPGTSPSRTRCRARACGTPRARSCARELTGPCLCRAASPGARGAVGLAGCGART